MACIKNIFFTLFTSVLISGTVKAESLFKVSTDFLRQSCKTIEFMNSWTPGQGPENNEPLEACLNEKANLLEADTMAQRAKESGELSLQNDDSQGRTRWETTRISYEVGRIQETTRVNWIYVCTTKSRQEFVEHARANFNLCSN